MLKTPLGNSHKHTVVRSEIMPSSSILSGPFKFRIKKGYTGKTAQRYNNNVRTLPKDF